MSHALGEFHRRGLAFDHDGWQQPVLNALNPLGDARLALRRNGRRIRRCATSVEAQRDQWEQPNESEFHCRASLDRFSNQCVKIRAYLNTKDQRIKGSKIKLLMF